MQINTKYPFIGVLDSRQGGRTENQDSANYIDTNIGLLVVVCDGMGGGPGGKIASSLAVETIIKVIQPATADSYPASALKAGIMQANAVLRKAQELRPELKGMGTTVTAMLINEHSATIAHVGDSRIYQFRFGIVKYCTPDHSEVGKLYREGIMSKEEARKAPNSNVIYRALGIGDSVEMDIMELGYDKGDRFALCTDGVWGAMPEPQLAKMLTERVSLPGTLEKLMIDVDAIGRQEGGHHDNFTIAIIETKNNSKYTEPMTHKIKSILILLCVVCFLSIVGNIGLGLSIMKDDTNENDVCLDSILEKKIDSINVINHAEISDMQGKFDSLCFLIRDNSRTDEAKKIATAQADIQSLRDSVQVLIEKLREIREMTAGKEKSDCVDGVIEQATRLKSNISNVTNRKYDEQFDKALTEMKKSKMKEEEDRKRSVKGQFNSIINILKSIHHKM